MSGAQDVFDEEIWWILNRLKKEGLLTDGSISVNSETLFEPESSDSNAFSVSEQKKLLNKLKDWGVLDWETYGWPKEMMSIGNVAPNTFITIHAQNFEKKYKEFERIFYKKVDQENSSDGQKPIDPGASLKSLHLITASLEPTTTIFLVLDKQFNLPIRCAMRGKDGHPSYMKKLYDIAYLTNAPGKKVLYDKNIADNINNGLFKMVRVAKYMTTNHFKKPTLVEKSEGILVLKNEVEIKTDLVKNIPTQYQSLYTDKTQ